MSFGFDPSIILSANRGPESTPQEALRSGLDFAKAQYQAQRQRTLADIVSQNAGAYQSPMGQALARGGYGQEASDAESAAMRRQELADQIGQLHASITRSRLSTVKTQDQYDKIPTDVRALYGLPDTYDPDAIQSFVASGLPPEKQAEYLDAQRRRSEMANPNSATSVLRTNVATQLGAKLQPGTPGNAVDDKEIELLEKAQAARQRTETARLLMGFGRGGGAPQGAGAPGPTQATTDGSPDPLQGLKPAEREKKWKELTDSVSTVKGRANLNAQLQNRLYASERVKNAAIDDNGNIKNLDPTMLNEVAAGTASLLANGSAPAEHTVQQFLPKGRGMGQASILEWLTNNPQGADQQGFIKQMVDLSNREEKLITKQMRSGQMQALPNYVGLRKTNRTRFDSILRGAGLDPTAVDENGLGTAGAAAAQSAAFTHVRTDPATGERRGWDGKQWVPLPAGAQ